MLNREGKLIMAPELAELLKKYLGSRNAGDLNKLVKWLSKPWGSNYDFLYELLMVELKDTGDIDELKNNIVELAVEKAKGRIELCSMYGLAKDYGLEDKALAKIDRTAAESNSAYYNKNTWKLLWATYPGTKLATMAEKKLADLGEPIPAMTEQEKALFTVQILMGSVAG